MTWYTAYSGCPMAMFAEMAASAFLVRMVHTRAISGLSLQTLAAFTVAAIIRLFRSCCWQMLATITGDEMHASEAWRPTVTGYLVTATFMGVAFHLARQPERRSLLDSSDDYTREESVHIWSLLFGFDRKMPSPLHLGNIYLSSLVLGLILFWAASGFSFFIMVNWAIRRPTALLSMFQHVLRGVGLLPQLHISRQADGINPALAIWIGMTAIGNLFEIIDDCSHSEQLYYFVGHAVSLLCAADFAWIFFRSQREKKDKVHQL